MIEDTTLFNIKEIMTTDVAFVKKDTSIYDVVAMLVEKNITGIPVVNDDMSLAGVITEKDMLRLLRDDPQAPGIVEDFMSTQVVSFDQNDDLIAVCECLVNSHFRRVPIVSGGKLVGVISRRDIIKYILEPI
jgi:CBS domain-containing protein